MTTARAAPRATIWPCVAAARHAHTPRLPLYLAGQATAVGSLAQADLPWLHAAAAGLPRGALRLQTQGVTFTATTAGERSSHLATLADALRAAARLPGWRDEVVTLWQPTAAGIRPVGWMERASARLWGTLTLGVHANGCTLGADGRPDGLWVARRALTKPTDPGLLDNLVAGGVAHRESRLRTLWREAWEEAGLRRGDALACRRARRVALARDVPEGFQREWLLVVDLVLPRHWQPRNQDGEVSACTWTPMADALALAQCGTMTVDAALATLDFALRHRLLPAPQHKANADALAALLVAETR